MTDMPTAQSLKAAAAARGLTLSDAEAKGAAAGAQWLKACVAQLRAAGFDR